MNTPPVASASRSTPPARIIGIDLPPDSLLGRAIPSRARASLERALGLAGINDLYENARDQAPLPQGIDGLREFLRRLLSGMNIRFSVSADDLARIPRKGPFIAVSNHPFGALDGIILAALLTQVRPDARVMANYLLARVPELRDLFIFVDPFGGTESAKRNMGPMRDCLRHLKDGGVLAAFPAGEVAHLKWGNFWHPDGRVTDPAWNDTIARMARKAGVPVVPIYFEGRNHALFQAAGLIHPVLRTAMLARAFLQKRDACVTLRVGSVIPARRVGGFTSDADLTDYLRRRTFLLRHGVARPSVSPVLAVTPDSSIRPAAPGRLQRLKAWLSRPFKAASPVAQEAIVDPIHRDVLTAEVSQLPADNLLLEQDQFAVYVARAPQIRQLLREIGRLREVTFRQVGEGTGKAIDLDTFDYDYLHLFIWNRQSSEVVGAYRLGQTDLLLPAKGRLGLYTSTLFNYQADLLGRLGPALEMGRSFVRPEYQKSYSPLLLLWKGIGHFLVRNPRYRHLFGPVSISNNYQTVSRQLMVQFLRTHHAMPDGELLAQPRNPFKPAKVGRLRRRIKSDLMAKLFQDDDEVSTVIADLEPDQKGIPILIRQYLKLGAKFVSFNVDRDFGDCLDGLIVVDLTRTEPKALERYMTRPGYAAFMAHHREPKPETAAAMA